MCFLQHKQYKPYDKWLGSTFKNIDTHHFFENTILEITSSKDIKYQIELLQRMLFQLGNYHNTLSLSRFVEPKITEYEVGVNNAIRPYLIFNSSDYKDARIEKLAGQYK